MITTQIHLIHIEIYLLGLELFGIFLNRILNKKNYKIIGVMSGTSIDGLDLVYVYFEKKEKWTYKIENSITYSYSKEWSQKLKTSVSLSNSDLVALDQDFTLLLSKKILKFINEFSIKDVDAISSHGHTVFHDPKNNFTYQIGNLPEISKQIGHKVICNFRQQDVKLGGQGAPLVPVGEKYLFSEYDSCVNLGGFANISKTLNEKLIAYDICPVNTVLNYLSNKINLDFDKDGEMSKSGKLIEDLYIKLNELEYFNRNYPKSLGIEWVNSTIIPLLNQYPSQVEDLLHTYSRHIAEQVSNNIKNEKNVLVTGGGAKNKFLIDLINKKLNNNVVIPDDTLIDYKEAIIFGFLGVLRLLNIDNCYSSVTGSSKDHCSGDIFLP